MYGVLQFNEVLEKIQGILARNDIESAFVEGYALHYTHYRTSPLLPYHVPSTVL